MEKETLVSQQTKVIGLLLLLKKAIGFLWFKMVNVLKVKVTENKIGTERTTYVLVNANGATGKIEVRQSAADVVFDITPTAIYLPQIGGEKDR